MEAATTLTISPTPKILAIKEGPLGWLVFNQPEKRNAVSLEMWEALPVIMEHFNGDDDIRLVILRGAGNKAFVSGADISQFDNVRHSVNATQVYDQKVGAANDAVYHCPKPTIAMIHGFCIGGGAGIAMCCDLRLASTESRFGVPAAKLGVGYGMKGIKNLMDVVGPANTMEIFFTARQFTAHEALGMGMVSKVLPPEGLEGFTRAYAKTIGNNAPLSIMAAKKAVKELLKNPDHCDEAGIQAAVEACFDSQDYIEGRTAFMEKRKAVFQGR